MLVFDKITQNYKKISDLVFSRFSEKERLYIYRAVFLAIVIRLALFFVGYIIGRTVPKYDTPIFNLIYQIFYKWDARAYLYLAEYGYTAVGMERTYLAYFPLYPALVNLFGHILPTYMTAALAVSFISSIFAGYFLQKLVSFDSEDDEVKRSLWFFYIFPTAYFLTVPYTEALFISLVLGAVTYARQKKWLGASIIAMFACATRLQGLVLIPTIMIEFWLHRKEVKLRQIFWLSVIPLGFVSYLLINWMVTGNPVEFLDIQRVHFYHHNILPTKQLWDTINNILFNKPSEMRLTLDEGRLVAVLITSVLLLISIKWLRISYQFYAWSQLIILLTDSWLMSLPRYILAIFPLFIVLARITKKPEVFQALSIISFALMTALYCLYVAGNWAF